MSEQKNEEITEKIDDSIKIDQMENKTELKFCDDVKLPQIEKSQALNDSDNINNELNVKILKLEHDLKERTDERENFKNKIDILETELSELKKQQPGTLSPAQQNEIEKIKKRSEDMLTKAKGIIFDKTKICKHQELQIEALSQQVSSLKEVLSITKNLLEIRNIEITHLQEKLDCMDLKIKAERQRQDLLHQKMEAMGTLNDTLKEEYQKQLVLFEEMQKKYDNDD